MTENNPTATTETNEPTAEVVVEQNFVQKFVNTRPRLAKVVAITGAALAVAGVGTVVNTALKNSHHLDNAGALALEAGQELSNAVSPTSETTEA